MSHDGKPLADRGTPGNLTAAEVEREIAADRAGFLSYARDLHSAGQAMVSLRRAIALVSIALLSACSRQEPPPAQPQPSPFKPSAGIQDIMAYMIDPAADFLWDSVSTTVNEKGVDEKQPRTDAEWNEVRRNAIIVAEASNLLMMEGRHVAKEGKQLEDHGVPGNLTAEEAEQAIAGDRAGFVSFAQALHDVGESMVAAADARNVQALFDAGNTLDQVCEGCHLKFWYPPQKK